MSVNCSCHADNGRCLTAARSIRCANQACSLGLSVTIGSVWIMSGIFLRTHSFPLRSLRVRLFYSDPLALLPLSLPGGRWRTNARAHHRPASRRARVPSLLGRFADDGIAMRAMDMDGADAPALFSGSRETVWAALPARPAALRRNPALRAGSSTLFQPQRLLFKAVTITTLCA
jgi:hypothetical protein